jgi:hypothetical protein
MGKSAITKKFLLELLEEERQKPIPLTARQWELVDEKVTSLSGLPENARKEGTEHFIWDKGQLIVNLIVSAYAGAHRYRHKALVASEENNLQEMVRHLIRAVDFRRTAEAYALMNDLDSTIAKDKAKRSHPETEPMRAKVVAYWRKHGNPKMSAAKAANELFGKFAWKNGDTVNHRKLADWISQAKREGRGPSKVT